MISLTQIETNFLLFGTSSIFHNDGLSIYQLGGKYLDRHSITFIKEDFEQVKLTKIEDRLIDASDELRSKISMLLEDAVNTVKKYAVSIGRQGVLISHSNIGASMNPHIHRQAYATESLPCITVHYNVTNNFPAIFRTYPTITTQEAIDHDLCRRDTIVEWCKFKPFIDNTLVRTKNVVLFNSGLIPHCVKHTEDVNIYFIFDHVQLIDPVLYQTDFAVIDHE